MDGIGKGSAGAAAAGAAILGKLGLKGTASGGVGAGAAGAGEVTGAGTGGAGFGQIATSIGFIAILTIGFLSFLGVFGKAAQMTAEEAYEYRQALARPEYEFKERGIKRF